MYVKPTAGLKVADPARADHLPEEGREVEATQYWQRRLNDGDVTEAKAPAAPAATNSKKES